MPDPIVETFEFTSGVQTFLVPPRVRLLTVECWGAQGGPAFGSPNTTAKGGYIRAEIPVSPGEDLSVYVGGQGFGANTGGFNGGGDGGPSSSAGSGGGGASDIRRGSGLADRLIVAGGGGGAGTNSSGSDGLTVRDGGAAGLIGLDGNYLGDTAKPGKGATSSAGGAAGTPATGGGTTATDGAFGVGGQGAGQGPLTAGTGAGGGGGGYYGGGGGGWVLSSQMAGGGGGSSWSSTVVLDHITGDRLGNGLIVLTYALPRGVTPLRQLQRDDRTRRGSSKQTSTRQGWKGTYL